MHKFSGPPPHGGAAHESNKGIAICGIMNRISQKGYLWNERGSKVLDAGFVAVRRIRCRGIPLRLRNDTHLPQSHASCTFQDSRNPGPARRLPWIPWLHELRNERLPILHLRMGTISYRSNQPWAAPRTVVHAIRGACDSRRCQCYSLSSRFTVRCHAGPLALETDSDYTVSCDISYSANHACGSDVPGATPQMVEGRIRLLCDLLASGTHGS